MTLTQHTEIEIKFVNYDIQSLLQSFPRFELSKNTQQT
jgi:hypothetical protein